MLTTVGMAMKAKVTDPVRAVRPVGREKRSLRKGANTAIPMKPITMLGIAARSSTPDLIQSRIPPGAISDMKMAAPIPRGMEMRIAPAVTRREPRIRGRMPNRGGSETGYQFSPKRNCHGEVYLRTDSPSRSRKRKIRATRRIQAIPLIRTHLSIKNSHTGRVRFRCKTILFNSPLRGNGEGGGEVPHLPQTGSNFRFLFQGHKIQLGNDLLPFLGKSKIQNLLCQILGLSLRVPEEGARNRVFSFTHVLNKGFT